MYRSAGRLLLIILLVLLLGWSAIPAAASDGGDRIVDGALPLDQVEMMRLEPVDHQRLLTEDAAMAGPGVPLRFATPRRVAITPETGGTWETLPDGSLLWRLRVSAEGALSLNFGFKTYQMPAGGTLEIHAPDGSMVLGPFTDQDNKAHGELWTPLLDGDEAVLEVHLSARQRRDLDLELSAVNLGYRYPELAEKSGACNVDVVCPEAASWGPQIRSVARISVSGTSLCTGSLVNNAAYDFDPLFLTADHCGLSPANAASLVVYWNYQNSTCRTPGGAASGGGGDGSLFLFQSGSTFLAGSSVSDFSLVRLDAMPPDAANAYWAGWDARPSEPDHVVTVHHPGGDEKRISFENDKVTISSWAGIATPGDGTHIRVADWDLGTAEGGSSGAPLFDPDGRVIGQLHGGYTSCSFDSPAWYGRLTASWDLGLEQWLDPLSTGTMFVDGIDQATYPFSIEVTPESRAVCAPDAAVFEVEVDSLYGFGGVVDLWSSGSPAGRVASFDPRFVAPPGTSTLIISTTEGAAPGLFSIEITGACGPISKRCTATVDLSTRLPDAPTLVSPGNGSVVTRFLPTFSWNAPEQALGYEIEVSRDATFAEVEHSAVVLSTSYTMPANLAEQSDYFWRVRAANHCGNSAFSAPFELTTPLVPPVLLVDDDDDDPDGRPQYCEVLDALGIGYHVWDVASERAEPDTVTLEPYQIVIWFTGNRLGGDVDPSAGPGPGAEAALVSFLDAGGRLVLSSMFYAIDYGETPLAVDYLGIASYQLHWELSIVSGVGPFAGLGPYDLGDDYLDLSCSITPAVGAEEAFVSDLGIFGISKTTAQYETVLLAFPFEAIATPADRIEVMDRLLGVPIFTDDFESGDLGRWTRTSS